MQAYICDFCEKVVPENEVRWLVSVTTSGGTIYHVHALRECLHGIAKIITDGRKAFEKEEKAALDAGQTPEEFARTQAVLRERGEI